MRRRSALRLWRHLGLRAHTLDRINAYAERPPLDISALRFYRQTARFFTIFFLMSAQNFMARAKENLGAERHTWASARVMPVTFGHGSARNGNLQRERMMIDYASSGPAVVAAGHRDAGSEPLYALNATHPVVRVFWF